MEVKGMSAAGLELTLYETFSLRLGNPESILFSGMTYGLGLRWENAKWLLSADYTAVAFDYWLTGDHEPLNNFRLAFGMRY